MVTIDPATIAGASNSRNWIRATSFHWEQIWWSCWFRCWSYFFRGRGGITPETQSIVVEKFGTKYFLCNCIFLRLFFYVIMSHEIQPYSTVQYFLSFSPTHIVDYLNSSHLLSTSPEVVIDGWDGGVAGPSQSIFSLLLLYEGRNSLWFLFIF